MVNPRLEFESDFDFHQSAIRQVLRSEANFRLAGLYDWLLTNEYTSPVIRELDDDVKIQQMLGSKPPSALTMEEIEMIGFHFMKEIKSGTDIYQLYNLHGISIGYDTNKIQPKVDEIIRKYIRPFLEYVRRKAAQSIIIPRSQYQFETISQLTYPLEIHNSIKKYNQDHQNVPKTAFIMMSFGDTKAHKMIVDTIKDLLSRYGIVALRADDKEYHDSLFPNVLTYIYGCDFGIAVYERLESDYINPNVSLEVGYLKALKKPLCLLKDNTMKVLPTDLLGQLYKPFDPQSPEKSIPMELEKWLRERDIIS